MSDLQNLGQITAIKHGMVVNIKASFGVPWTRKYYNMVNHIFLRSPLVHLSNQQAIPFTTRTSLTSVSLGTISRDGISYPLLCRIPHVLISFQFGFIFRKTLSPC